MGNNICAQGMVRDLVNQFSDTLAFYRELIQNAIDAGSNRIDVSLEYVPGPPGAQGLAVIRVEDDGCGMDEAVIDNYLLVLFRSTKEDDLTKIGKFGVGFLSVFALKPSLVRLYTAKNMQSWRLDFPDYRSYNKYRMPDPRDGTLVEIHKMMSAQEYAELCDDSLATVKHWCRHADTRVFFRNCARGGAPQPVNEPFALPDGESLRYAEEGTEVVMGFSAPEAVAGSGATAYTGADKPFFGFYNRGLTLKEGRKVFIPGVEFKIKSRYLEHTITRDNVMEDANYQKAMAIIKRLASKELPKKLRPDLEALAVRMSDAAAQRDPAAMKALEYEWARRKTLLKIMAGSFLAGFKYDFEEWKILPAVDGGPVAIEDLTAAWKKLRRPGGLYDDIPAYFTAMAPDVITRALCALGAPVLLETATCRPAEFIAWAGETMVPAKTAELVSAEEAARDTLPPELAAFLKTVPRLGGVCGGYYTCVYPAWFTYESPSIAQQPFLFRARPYGLGHRDEG
ncbi:MAG TPA: ATP-binding protein, partial [Elusimicrobiales bacterium]|nr:ATP-binding protein [Elusimicrobiales bacterium]